MLPESSTPTTLQHKRWVFAALALATLGIGIVGAVHGRFVMAAVALVATAAAGTVTDVPGVPAAE